MKKSEYVELKLRANKNSRNDTPSGVDQPIDDDSTKRDPGDGVDSDCELPDRPGNTKSGKMKENNEPLTPNFWVNRGDEEISGIVIHRSEGSLASNLAWIAKEKSKVSYHAIIDEKGEVTTILDDDLVAWHAGVRKHPIWPRAQEPGNPNNYTLGLALSGTSADPVTIFQFFEAARWIYEKCKKYNIPIDENHIIPHNYIRTDKTCPGHAVSMQALIFIANLF